MSHDFVLVRSDEHEALLGRGEKRRRFLGGRGESYR